MAAVNCDRSAMDQQFEKQNGMVDRLKKLYPAVKEEKTPLPRSWSTKEKYTYIGLSQNNLRVHYKGHGKTHRDAASVQATHPIPASCGLYYFEVKIVSKGRDGYMGIGLSAQGVNMNRLPGWDKQSYGYHGDDGHSFCSSGTGQPYGPTFTTGDVIGCGVNLVENTCFYTKNGHHLGIAFRDLPPNLYPTVGLQTPGEVVDANFGQEPFLFDIEDMMNELKTKTKMEIYNFPVPESQGEWQAILSKMVSSYLIHHGYCNTAEAFAQITNTPFSEDLNSIKNRKKILKLVLAGKMGEAIERTFKLYPGLLENNQNLLFMLKCRQFVEMINGTDLDRSLKRSCTDSNNSSPPRPASPVLTSVIQSTKNFSNKQKQQGVQEMNQANAAHKGSFPDSDVIAIGNSDVEMDVTEESQNGHGDNITKTSISTNGYQNGNSHIDDSQNVSHTCDNNDDEEMDVDEPCSKKACTQPEVERILEFGRELYSLSQRLKADKVENETNQKMLEDAFSLLAYSNPWSSPVGWQLRASERENICASLNSAILESNNKPRRPPLEVAVAHAQELVRLMSASGLGACAFTSLFDIIEQ
ncbi:ran-binding protein 9 isoform X2 [Harmonia axyridis]|uniref:ran-binding protein 9 isoform X2 n=1 Tax=Harmonia axyridis TaxID=115357 RepID=UPI001E2793EA|nr:ran-binding protein 9 isoform X2 [Harmonia axyridis]